MIKRPDTGRVILMEYNFYFPLRAPEKKK